MIRVFVIDDHHLARRGLGALLAGQTDVQLLGESATTEVCPSRLEQLRPHVVILGLSGPESLSSLKTLRGRWPTLVVSLHSDVHSTIQAIQAGARGYLNRMASERELLAAVESLWAGRSYLQPDLGVEAVQYCLCPGPTELTGREREVLELCASSLSNAEIAAQLVITKGTVKTHVNSLLRKLGAQDRAQAVVKAERLGLLQGRGKDLPTAR